ncbi:MAG TPA: tetratricopeptide repeat protein [Lacunisphaera sp.]
MPSFPPGRRFVLPVIRLIVVLSGLLSGVHAFALTESEWKAVRPIREARLADDLPRALLYANNVIKLAPQLAEAYEERAQILRATGDLPGARRDLDRVLDLQPKSRTALALRARVRLEQSDYEGAIADAAVAGRSEEMLNVHGEALMALNRYREALEDFKILRGGSFGPNTNSRFPYALCLFALGDVAGAVPWFETEITDGGLIEAHRMLVLGLCLLGRHDEAEKRLASWMETAAKPAPTDDYDRYLWTSLHDNRDEAVLLSAVVRYARADFTGAVAVLDRIEKGSDQADQARLLRHAALLRSGHPDDGLKNAGEPKDAWTQVVRRYLLGGISDKELLAKTEDTTDFAERRRRECEAGFYAGQKRLAAGDDLAASLLFEKAAATRMISLPEYILTQIALGKAGN